MARENRLANWINANSESEFLRVWNLGGESRENLINQIGYASEGGLYNAARNALIIPGGPVSNGNKNPDNDSGGEKSPRKARNKGVLPKEIEEWVKRGLVAQYVRDGGDEDDFICPEITPEFFLSYRPVRDETEAFVIKAMNRIGGFDSEAGRSLRAWAGRPLTREQEEQEAAINSAPRDRAIAINILKTAGNGSKEFNSAIVDFIYNQFGESFLDRIVNGELLPI